MLILKEGANNLLLLLQESLRLDAPLIFPTDTIYGIGAPISSVIGNKKIFEIKKRPLNMPFPILVGSTEQAGEIAEINNLSDEKASFIEQNKNKAVTYILPAKKSLDSLYVKDGAVAVRITHPGWLALGLQRFGCGVTATSVNISKEPPADSFKTAFDGFKNSVDLFIQGTPHSTASSEIYDMTKENIIQIR